MKIIVQNTKFAKYMFDSQSIDFAKDKVNNLDSAGPRVIVYLDQTLKMSEYIEHEIHFNEVYALNVDGTRSFRKCVTLEDFYAFLEEETRYMKGVESHEK